jgi:hypothetical protein
MGNYFAEFVLNTRDVRSVHSMWLRVSADGRGGEDREGNRFRAQDWIIAEVMPNLEIE